MTKIKKPLPKYVSLGSTELILDSNEYYRHAGAWGVDYYWDGDVLRAKSDNHRLSHVNGLELVPSTEEKWREDNYGYVPEKMNNDETATVEDEEIPFDDEDDEPPF